MNKINWDGNKMNNYFIKKAESVNDQHYENKRPKLETFNKLRISAYALKNFYETCAMNAWEEDQLFRVLTKIANSNIPVIDNFNYLDYDSNYQTSLVYIKTQRDEAKQILADDRIFPRRSDIIT